MKSSSNRFSRFTFLLFLSLLVVAVGCRTPKTPEPTEPPPEAIKTVKIGNFQCENAVTAQAVRHVFIEILGRNRFIKVIREGEADVLIEGTITHGVAGSSTSGFAAGGNWASGSSRYTGGEYVSGVTSIALRNGEVLTSASWGQVMAKGKEILPPELVARQAAIRMMDSLYRKGLKKR